MAYLLLQHDGAITSTYDTLSLVTHSILYLEKTLLLMIENVNVNLGTIVVREKRGTLKIRDITIAINTEATQTATTTDINIMVIVEQKNDAMTLQTDTHPERTITLNVSEKTVIAMMRTIAMTATVVKVAVEVVVVVTVTKNHTDETVFIDKTAKFTANIPSFCAAHI